MEYLGYQVKLQKSGSEGKGKSAKKKINCIQGTHSPAGKQRDGPIIYSIPESRYSLLYRSIGPAVHQQQLCKVGEEEEGREVDGIQDQRISGKNVLDNRKVRTLLPIFTNL